jgi:uncharacterized protein YprB with RNaseH-like and TPR domain
MPGGLCVRMIRRTFLILPTVGTSTERSLWGRGVLDWDDFLDRERIDGFSAPRKRRLDRGIEDARHYLDLNETNYFSRLLPSREHWRLYDHARRDVAYLDIETDGLDRSSIVTVVGVHRAGASTTLVRGIDLSPSSLAHALKGVKMLVTFNGSTFDLPFLEREFPFAVPRVPHFDLRHGCARIGLRGGLKSIERQLGMSRAQEVEYVTGEQAVYLWHLWERKGKRNALELLKRYNQEDTQNLEPIAALAYDRLRRSVLDRGGGEDAR